METLIIATVVGAVVGAGIAWWLGARQSSQADGNAPALVELKEQLRGVHERLDRQTNTVEKRLDKSHDNLSKTVNNLNKDFRQLTKEMTSVKETGQKVFAITDDLKNLKKVLTNQKQRGSLGEAGLTLILENILPPNAFELQYRFENGDAVDAVIRARDGLIPIDAKYSLTTYEKIIACEDDNEHEQLIRQFKQDIKKRVQETAKYIRPKENTLPFAMMYVPAEGVYYDLLVNKIGDSGANPVNLIEYAHEQDVVIVSPTTLSAYLQTILQGLRAFRIEKNAERIQAGIESLRKHFRSYEDAHQRLGKNLNAAVNHYDKTNVKLRGIGKDVGKITNSDFDLDGIEAENPRLES